MLVSYLSLLGGYTYCIYYIILYYTGKGMSGSQLDKPNRGLDVLEKFLGTDLDLT